ncbi:MAG: hypothetical protein JWN77_54 [Frankiales bacterium]|jgi:hypothetical protein|nr:hypothetical protein [Frankiales bacterium]
MCGTGMPLKRSRHTCSEFELCGISSGRILRT